MPGAYLVQGPNQLDAAVAIDQPARILVVDDDPVHCLLIRRILEPTYEVLEASDGLEGVRAFHEARPDLVLLDTVLPHLDGWEVLRRIREVADTPVIMLTVRQDPGDIVRGLRDGADDYVTKPFTVEVLEARVEALLRRVARGRREARASGRVELDDGRLVVDLVRAQVQKDGRLIDLSATEYRLLAFLALRPDQIVHPTQILAHVWGPDYTDEIGYVKSYVRLLRRKIEDDPSAPLYLIARRGLGYTLVSRPSR